jgi:hypothetical protein
MYLEFKTCNNLKCRPKTKNARVIWHAAPSRNKQFEANLVVPQW